MTWPLTCKACDGTGDGSPVGPPTCGICGGSGLNIQVRVSEALASGEILLVSGDIPRTPEEARRAAAEGRIVKAASR